MSEQDQPAVGLAGLLAGLPGRWERMAFDEGTPAHGEALDLCARELRAALREDPTLRLVAAALAKIHTGLTVLNDHHTKDHHGGVLLELDEAVSDAFLAHRAAAKALRALLADGGGTAEGEGR